MEAKSFEISIHFLFENTETDIKLFIEANLFLLLLENAKYIKTWSLPLVNFRCFLKYIV